MSSFIRIQEVRRSTENAGTEVLNLEPGVNVIVGPPNSGKTTWLRMIDYIFGDKDKPEEAFEESLVEKYDSISADILINEEFLSIERRFGTGYRTKVLVNGQKIDESSFSEYILDKLNYPELHFPKGNPYDERKWPELSWRMMLRHIYRNEDSWYSSLAAKQPESEQHAVLTYFLGVAERLFPQRWEELIRVRQKLSSLKSRREQFMELVEEFSSDLLSDDDTEQFITKELITERKEELSTQRESLLEKRSQVVEDAAEKVSNGESSRQLALSKEKSTLARKLENIQTALSDARKRYRELDSLQSNVEEEIERLVRTRDAGSYLADLKVTHCPVCDQEVSHRDMEEGECFLCNQEIDSSTGEQRIEFEIEQLSSEDEELSQLMEEIRKEIEELESSETELERRINEIDDELRPLRSDVSGLVQEDISSIDTRIGRIDEQIEQLSRFESVMERRNEINDLIKQKQNKIDKLEDEVDQKRKNIDLEKPALDLVEDMHNYINKINQYIDKRRIDSRFIWNFDNRISLDIRKRDMSFRIGSQKWHSQIGATRKIFFLLAYNFALMRLTDKKDRRYPGISILDFPPDLVGEETIGDRENYLIEPYIEACNNIKNNSQVIVAGRSFKSLNNVNRIELNEIWN